MLAAVVASDPPRARKRPVKPRGVRAAVGTTLTERRPVPTREEFEAAWKELGGSVRGVARKLGRDRRQVYRWADAYGLRAAVPAVPPRRRRGAC
jgi:hypothetical protein